MLLESPGSSELGFFYTLNQFNLLTSSSVTSPPCSLATHKIQSYCLLGFGIKPFDRDKT
jgi:hypothetical protein